MKIFNRLCLAVLSLAISSSAMAQNLDTIQQHLKADVYYLASDKLKGRLTGSEYEHEAGEYIAGRFRSLGLKPEGDKGTYFQAFTFHTAYSQGKNNSLSISGKKYTVDKDFYPMVYSKSGKLKGQVVAINFKSGSFDIDQPKPESYKGKILLADLSGTHADPHETAKAWRQAFDKLKGYAPAGILFYNSPDSVTADRYRVFNNLKQEDLVLLAISPAVAKDILQAKSAKASIQVDLQRKEVTGHNILGYLDNGNSNTIVIGAHYDHLGYDEYGGSLYRGIPEIHNGADDNASGTATMMELARLVKGNAQYRDYNFLFVAFSGEEEGLLGSNYLVKHPPLPMKDIQCMINMDMVGRLDTMKRELGIYGTGTSPSWDSLLRLPQLYQLSRNINISGSPNVQAQQVQDNTSRIDTFHVKKSPSGLGASDHSSFYLEDVPVLHFFTGYHKDYHKPTDDADKINYAGMAQVTVFIYNLTCIVDKRPRLKFQKTKEESAAVPSFKVTLGIVPDYFYEGEGVRVDGISPGKSAEKAGLKKGDVIQKLGTYDVKDMQSYMEALGKFNKGQQTKVAIKRDAQILELPVTF